MNDTGRERANVLSIIGSLVREPVRGVRSIRCAARGAGVSDRTVRRWLAGQHWPARQHLRALMSWARRAARE